MTLFGRYSVKSFMIESKLFINFREIMLNLFTYKEILFVFVYVLCEVLMVFNWLDKFSYHFFRLQTTL